MKKTIAKIIMIIRILGLTFKVSLLLKPKALLLDRRLETMIDGNGEIGGCANGGIKVSP
jgi:hypothetical protein